MTTFIRSLLNGAESREAFPKDITLENVFHSPQKPTIVDAHDKAQALVKSARAKKAHWEKEIARATEELRQAEVVLAGATLLLETVTAGLEVNVSDEFERAMSEELTNSPV